MNTNFKSALLGGLIATVAMTVLIFIAPLMGMPKMLIGNMIAHFMQTPVTIGWIMHLLIGIILAAGYVFFWKDRFSNNPVVKGLIYSMLPFLIAQLIVMPMMGAGLFSANTPAPLMMVIGSLIGHFVYGATLGAVTK